MKLSFSSFFRFLFHERGTYENKDLIYKAIYGETFSKMRFAVAMGALVQVVLFVLSLFPARDYGNLIAYYRLMYIGLFVLMVISQSILMYVKKDYERRLGKLIWISPIVSLLIITGGMCAACLDAFACGFANPVMYMTVILVIPLCVYMHPMVFLLISLFTDSVMLILYDRIRRVLTMPSAPTDEVTLYLVAELVIGLLILFLQFSYRENNISNEKQKREISELNNAQNRFFSSMSHEIRTPINTIIGLNEMILRERVSDEVAENATNIRAASNLLLHLINDILDMSKITLGQMKITPVNYRPGDMLSDIVGMLWLRSKEKGLDFHVEVSPDIPSELYGDEVRIKQILINVLNNAIKYTKKGSVTLTMQCSGIKDGIADIVYSVKDTGMGIRKESMPYLFTAFKRVDEVKNRYIEGTGLGLSIVKQLTELMGGTVSVNSVYTQGSTFIITIPQTVNDYSEIGNINLEEKHRVNTSGSYRCLLEAPKAKILVVDDNESNLLVMRKLLRDTKVALDTAASGREALELTLEKSYDVIFMDHMMPEMDGVECFHRIQNQVGGASKDSKVVALTANAGSEMKKIYTDEGFDGYIVKPVNAGELDSELIRLLPKELVTLKRSDEDIIANSMSWLDASTRKKNLAVTTESVADLPGALLDKYSIEVIPHKVETENGIFADGLEIDSDGLMDYMTENHVIKTHSPSVADHEDFFAKALAGANNVLHMSISSRVEHSGYQSAVEGAETFDNVTVYDTGHLSSGQGLLTIAACRMAAEGLSVAETVKRLDYVKKCISTSFIVDNLDYLARSGQVGFRLAAICKAVMFRPVIEMKRGKMTLSNFFFGSRKRSWEKYIEKTLVSVSDIDNEILFITYVGLNKSDLDFIRKTVENKIAFEHVYCQKASPSIAVNCGPGTFGLLFANKL